MPTKMPKHIFAPHPSEITPAVKKEVKKMITDLIRKGEFVLAYRLLKLYDLD